MIKCENCGTIKYVLIGGYQIGDRLLEGVFFRVYYDSKGNVSSVRIAPDDKEYFEQLNTKMWLEAVKDFAKSVDDAECPKCGETVYL